jgi:hypothetical protein
MRAGCERDALRHLRDSRRVGQILARNGNEESAAIHKKEKEAHERPLQCCRWGGFSPPFACKEFDGGLEM